MALVAKGYEASTVLEQKLGGEHDQNIAAICRRESRIVVTLDTDFGDIRAYPPSSYPGIIVLRLKRQDKVHVIEVFERLIPLIEREDLAGNLWIVEEGRVRIRT